MKKLLIFLILTGTAFTVSAQAKDTIRITGTRFTFPVFKRWIDEYKKTNPFVEIIVKTGIPADSTDIFIVSHMLKPGDVKEGQTAVAVARYVQLAVVNSRRADLKLLTAKGFNDSSFKKIYFTELAYGDEARAMPFAVYRRQKASCSSVAFANHFGNEFKDIKGTAVAGDDQNLLEAVKHDKNAISYNNLGLIYNLSSRKINDSIAIIPIDFNGNGKVDANEKIYSTVDEVVAFAEKTTHPKIPIENVNVIFSKSANKQVKDFLEWILVNGRQYNHHYGLLNLEPAASTAAHLQLTAIR